MSAVAAIDIALQFSAGADYEGATSAHVALIEARQSIIELIRADEEFDAAGEALEEVQTGPKTSYRMLSEAVHRYDYARDARTAAIARIKGEAQ